MVMHLKCLMHPKISHMGAGMMACNRYGGYYGNGAPSDWAGIMLVSAIFINGEVNGYLKVAWDMSMSQYIMKNNKDGSVAHSWKQL